MNKMMLVIKTVCAYCGTLVHDGELVDGRVSHGCCATCFAGQLALIKGRAA